MLLILGNAHTAYKEQTLTAATFKITDGNKQNHKMLHCKKIENLIIFI